jgi:ABC-2 type transport system permease protein
VSSPGTTVWFAQHEFRLAWRDWLSMMMAGRRGRERTVAIALIAVAVFLHFVAYSMVARFADLGADADKTTLVVITVCALLSWSLMVSQAMESVTRAFYARSDLDLILSSPAAARKIFAVRIATMALSIVVMAMMLATPFIDVLAVRGGVHWLAAFPVVAAMGAAAAAFAVALTVLLFRTIGPKRTRLVAQIVAAVIGAAFVIGLQVAAILSYGTLSRLALLQSSAIVAHAPDIDSVVWWPARAILGDPAALAAVVVASLALLGATIAIFSPRFADHAVAAAGVSHATVRQAGRSTGFRRTSAQSALRGKEWTLLKRDPWLMSQTLMQILYLLPPALLLWRSFGTGTDAYILLAPVLVMAAGQLAGGLAWLAICGEDAPDLVATAPVAGRSIVRAKIEAVLGAVAMVFSPFILVLAVVSPFHAVVSTLGIVAAAISATAIQLWFRAQAKRSLFRRRQTSSRMATFAEAFASISWAAAAALAAGGTWLAGLPALIAIGVLATARLISPSRRAA